MKKYLKSPAVLLTIALLASATGGGSAFAQGHYQSFIVSMYAIQGTVQRLMRGHGSPAVVGRLTRNLKVDKIYIEVMRNHTLVDEAGLERLKKFFQDQGVEVCGGLAYSVSEANGYQGFDYADPENREFAQKSRRRWPRAISTRSSSTITSSSIARPTTTSRPRATDRGLSIASKRCAKWRENLIVKPAKAVNPKCKVIIKMANWYDQYAGMGNDTEKVPLIADGMFSGTESRSGSDRNSTSSPTSATTSCGSWTTSSRA